MMYGAFASIYDRLMIHMPYDQWLEFTDAALRITNSPVAPALIGTNLTIADVGCGTGTLSLTLAEQGHQVYGIDFSSDMLTIAASKDGRQQVTWIEQNMCQLELPQRCDVIVSYCDSINYLLEEDEVESAFERIHHALKPGGIFLFDVHAVQTFVDYANNQPYIYDDEEVAYLWASDYDDSSQKIVHDIAFFVRTDDGKYERFDEQHEQRSYPLETMERMLNNAGFTYVQIYADFMLKEPDESSKRWFIVAMKQ